MASSKQQGILTIEEDTYPGHIVICMALITNDRRDTRITPVILITQSSLGPN